MAERRKPKPAKLRSHHSTRTPVPRPLRPRTPATISRMLSGPQGPTLPEGPPGPPAARSEYNQPVKKPTLGVEYGVSGTQNFGGQIRGDEYAPELSGAAGLAMYDKMRRSDAQVRATLQVMKLPLLAATWAATPPTGGDDIDQQIADFVNLNLFDDDGMTDSWTFVLRHILLQLDFGFSILEKRWRVDDEGQFFIERLAPRLAKTVHAWHVGRDGRLIRIWQYAPVIKDTPDTPSAPAGRMPQPPTSTYEYIPIPGDCLCVFTLDREGDNFEGLSMLRSSYRNWYYKDLIYHLDGVRLDRYGVGIPVAELGPAHGLSNDDLDELESVLKDLRSNERVYLVAPPDVRFRILAPEGGGGATSTAGSLIDHHDMMISRNVLAGFLTTQKDSQGLNAGQGTGRLTDFFISALYGLVAQIAADLKRAVVKPLCDLNFNMTERDYPSIVVRDLESNDIERTITLLLQAVGTIITPDDDLEAMLRRALKLPPLPDHLTREAQADEAKQAAAEAALRAPLGGPVLGAVPPALAPHAAGPSKPGDPPATHPDGSVNPPGPDQDPDAATDYTIRANPSDLLHPWAIIRTADQLQAGKYASKSEAQVARRALRGHA